MMSALVMRLIDFVCQTVYLSVETIGPVVAFSGFVVCLKITL
jgi:hypothetical protein